MKKLSLCFYLLFFHCSFSNAQNQDRIWIFGDSCGIDFNNLSNPASFVSTRLNSLENFNAICSPQGQLLFYLTGAPLNSLGNVTLFSRINNSLYQQMDNGDSVKNDYSETQGSLIIPFQNDSSKFYLFHLTIENPYPTPRFYYSVIDMSYNGGLGKIISKNNLVTTQLMGENLCAVRHGNGRDWWVVSHGSNTDAFYTYLISPAGISSPLIQHIGSFIPQDFCSNSGQMNFNKSGDKLISVNLNGIANLLNFNRCDGTFSNCINLNDSAFCSGYYGACFSSLGNMLYISSMPDGSTSVPLPCSIYQFDLTSSNILSSKNVVWTMNIQNYIIGQLKLAPDDKVYVSNSPIMFPSNITSPANLNLSVINNPDSYGSGCNFTPYSFNLNGATSRIGLPNIPNYNLQNLEGSSCDTLTSVVNTELENAIFNIYPNPTKGSVTFNYKLMWNEKGKIVVNDNLCNQLRVYNLEKDQCMLKMNTQGLAAGVYTCKFYKDNSLQVVSKLIVVR